MPNRLYDFDSLQHGDALQVDSVKGAQEMFRRWRKANRRHNAELVKHNGFLVFLEDAPRTQVADRQRDPEFLEAI